jgi:outer membrane immunogenic protein
VRKTSSTIFGPSGPPLASVTMAPGPTFSRFPEMASGVVACLLAVASPAGAQQPADWGGFYGGAAIGFGSLDGPGGTGEGVRPGLRAGYDLDLGRLVLGAGIGLDLGEIGLPGGSGQLDGTARLGLRGGFDLGQTLFYATAGAARTDGDLGGTGFSDTGIFGGIGAEYRLGERVTLGGEVLLYRFGDVGGTGTDLDAATAGLNIGLRF